MAGNTLDLLIQARADFGNAQSQIKNLHNLLQGLDRSTPGGLISLPADTMKNIEALQKALAKVGMAGKALKDIQFPEGKFRAAAAQVEQMRRNFEQIQKTNLGRQVRQMAQSAGQDTSNPLGWNWNRMTRGMQAQDAMLLRNAYRNALYQVHGAPPGPGGGGPGGPGGHGGGRDWGAMGGRFGSWMGNSIGGGIMRTGGMIGSLAVGGGIMGAMFAGYRENQQTLEGVDAIFKSIGGNAGGFQALKDQVTELGSALQITGSAASELAASFVRTSGANDQGALDRAQAAGQFGRGLGMDPGASAQLFGRAGLIGVGNTRQTQRDFASLMGKTIADSGMFARSEQVMEGMVGQLERIASTQGRTASAGEMQSISAILGDLLKNPALRGGGAESVMGVAQRLGNGSDLAMAMMAYEELTGGDLGKTIEIANADPMTPISQLRGFEGTGITDTRADYMVRNVRRLSQRTGLDEGQFAALHFGVNPELYRQYAQTFDGKRLAEDDSGFRSWMSGVGLNPDQVNMGGLGTLADIYKNQGAAPGSAHINRLVALGNEYLSNDQLKDQPELARDLRGAMGPDGSPAKLQEVMAKIAGTVGAPLTEADITRRAQADLTTAFGKVGEAINRLIPPIKEGLTPAVEKAAEYLSDILDFFGVNDSPYKAGIGGMAGNLQRQADDDQMDAWRRDGFLRDDFSLNPDKPMPDWMQGNYNRLLERRRQAAATGSAPPPSAESTAAGSAAAPSSRPVNPAWNVAPPQASNSGVTGSAAAVATQAALDPNAPGRNVLLDMIAGPESGGHYNAMYRNADQTDIDLTNMTMDEIDALQTSMIRERGGSVIGRYQYKQKTLRGLRADMGIGGSEKFTPELQDRLATESMRRRGLLDWEAGTMPDEDFQFNLSQEWAGLPKDATGLSYHHGYNGNRAGISPTAMRQAMSQAKAARAESAAAPAAPVAVEPAVAPAAPVAAEPAVAPDHARDLAVLAPRMGLDGPRQQVVPVTTINPEETKARLTPEQRAMLDRATDTGQPTPPPTPEPVASMTNPTAANARVDGQVAVNINVAKDGKPVSESFRALSFAEPRVPGSGGTLPKNNRVEWSNTV